MTEQRTRYLVKRIRHWRRSEDVQRVPHIAVIPILGEVDAVILTACGRKLAWTEWRVSNEAPEDWRPALCETCDRVAA